MKRRRVLFIQLSQFRLFIRKLVVAVVMFSALGLLILSRADSAHLGKAEDIVSKTLNPIIRVLQLPADGVYFCYEGVRDVVRVYYDNKILKQRIETLSRLNSKNQSLRIENELLSQMLHYTPPPEATFVTAKIIAGESDVFSHSVIAYVSEKPNVQKGQVVLDNQNVVGRIESVHGNYVRILLVSDINSKIPVLIERTRGRGILSGNNTETLKLLFTGSNSDIRLGDKVVTSGVGGIFPSGLTIGYVSKIYTDAVDVKPASTIDMIEYVKIVSYGLNNTLLKENEAR
ncbi:MAG: rod shape-determining protein MreC [Alphaproteobacteria bacterium]|nr:rod shape-determining protein MreC [Alphaproteobacteria bacterium]